MDNKYKKAIILNYIFRILGLFLSFVVVRIELAYLGKSLYGAWVTILSIVSWMSYGDFGIGNGLRNELSVAVGEDNKEKEILIVNSVMNMLLKLCGILFVVFIVLTETLFLMELMDSQFRIPMYITNVFFCFNMLLSVSKSIAFSHQMSWITTLSTTLSSLFTIVGILGLMITPYKQNLLLFSFICGLAGCLANFTAFSILKLNKIVIPSIRSILSKNDNEIVNTVVKLGLQFFLLQICGLILDSTDNLIINKLYGTDAVTGYSLINKVYNTADQMFAIILIGLWSEVTIQSTKKNYKWIIGEIKNVQKFWILFTAGIILLTVLFNPIMKIWLGQEYFRFDMTLVWVFAIYEIMQSFGAIYVNVANGLSWIRVEMIIVIFGAVINIPLSVFLAKAVGLGLPGIKIATFIGRLGTATVLPFVIMRQLNRQNNAQNHCRAHG